MMAGAAPRRPRYSPPERAEAVSFRDLLADIGRPGLSAKQLTLLSDKPEPADPMIFYAGDLGILRRPAVAIVGARDVSEHGAARARKLAKQIAAAGVTVVSGLAKGVDANAHRAALGAGGLTAAVIGTPLSQVYPAENSELQAEIAAHYLLLTPFAEGTRVFPTNFPKRNRIMAAVTDGSVIIEASDSSGTLHQAAECQRLGRWLFILQSVFEDPSLKWPQAFSSYERMKVVSSADDVLASVIV